MRVLLANGFEVIVPTPACSGLPAKSRGDRAVMTDMAAANVDVLRELKVDLLVGDVASCTADYKQYDTVPPGDPLHAIDAQRVAQRTIPATGAPRRLRSACPAGTTALAGGHRRALLATHRRSGAVSVLQRLLTEIPRLELVPFTE